MPASPAQIEANRRNAARSTGPNTPEGKARSRGNAVKHGLTGSGVALPEEDAARVERLAASFRSELKPAGEVGEVLVRRLATMAVRMDRCVEHESAALAGRVREAVEGFEAPADVDADEADRLRAEAGRRAFFDPSKEAGLARKYEAAAERGFYKALKEIRQAGREAVSGAAPSAAATVAAEASAEARASLARLASFFPAATPPPPAPAPAPAPAAPRKGPIGPPPAGWDPFAPARVDVPITIGRPR